MTSLRKMLGPVASVLRRHLPPGITLLALCCILHPSSALGQIPDRKTTAVEVSSPAADRSLRVARFSIPVEMRELKPSWPQPGASRDSLKNGAIVGAVVGAVAFGTLAAIVCRAYQEEDGPSCLDDTLRFAAIGGAIGSGVGLAIDVARHQRSGVSVRLAIKF